MLLLGGGREAGCAALSAAMAGVGYAAVSSPLFETRCPLGLDRANAGGPVLTWRSTPPSSPICSPTISVALVGDHPVDLPRPDRRRHSRLQRRQHHHRAAAADPGDGGRGRAGVHGGALLRLAHGGRHSGDPGQHPSAPPAPRRRRWTAIRWSSRDGAAGPGDVLRLLARRTADHGDRARWPCLCWPVSASTCTASKWSW